MGTIKAIEAILEGERASLDKYMDKEKRPLKRQNNRNDGTFQSILDIEMDKLKRLKGR